MGKRRIDGRCGTMGKIRIDGSGFDGNEMPAVVMVTAVGAT
jgi:hypothetical protein